MSSITHVHRTQVLELKMEPDIRLVMTEPSDQTHRPVAAEAQSPGRGLITASVGLHASRACRLLNASVCECVHHVHTSFWGPTARPHKFEGVFLRLKMWFWCQRHIKVMVKESIVSIRCPHQVRKTSIRVCVCVQGEQPLFNF